MTSFRINLLALFCAVLSSPGQEFATPLAKPAHYPAFKLTAHGDREPTPTELNLQENFDRIFQKLVKQEPMDPDLFFRATVNKEVVEQNGLRFSGVYYQVPETPQLANLVFEFLLTAENPDSPKPVIRAFNLVTSSGKVRSSLSYKEVPPSDRIKANFPECATIYSFITQSGEIKPGEKYALWIALDSEAPATMGCRVQLIPKVVRRKMEEDDWMNTHSEIKVSNTGKGYLFGAKFTTPEQFDGAEEDIKLGIKVKIPTPVSGDFVFMKAATEGLTSDIQTQSIKVGSREIKSVTETKVPILPDCQYKKKNPDNKDESLTVIRIPQSQLTAGDDVELIFKRSTSKTKMLWYCFNLIAKDDTDLAAKLLLTTFQTQ